MTKNEDNKEVVKLKADIENRITYIENDDTLSLIKDEGAYGYLIGLVDAYKILTGNTAYCASLTSRINDL